MMHLTANPCCDFFRRLSNNEQSRILGKYQYFLLLFSSQNKVHIVQTQIHKLIYHYLTEYRNNDGFTIMHVATKSGNVEHIKALLDMGGKPLIETTYTPHAKQSKEAITPVHIAIQNKEPEIFRLLLKNSCSKEVILKKVKIENKGEMLMNYAMRMAKDCISSKGKIRSKTESALLVRQSNNNVSTITF